MKKKFVRVMLFGALTLSAAVSFVGCKDYDDDISRLEKDIAANKTAIDEINTLIKSGSVITSVDDVTGGVKVTMSDGKSFTITNGEAGAAGKDGATWTIEKDGYWYKNGEKSEYKAVGQDGKPGADGKPGSSTPGTPGKDGDCYIPGEDGFWYKNSVKPENKTTMSWIIPGVVTVADMGDYYLFTNMRNADGTKADAVKINKYSSTFVSSLVHVPSNLNKDLGDVVFLPVIGTDNNSTQTSKVYEYNWTSKAFATTMVNGWAQYEYEVNPASVDPKNYSVVNFIEETATVTKATTIGLPTMGTVDAANGKLIIKASAKNFNMYKIDDMHDDPAGKPASEASNYGEKGKVNMIALKVKNVNADQKLINDGEVISDYVATKRMVVEQEDAMIGIARNRMALDKEVASFTNLSQMYTNAATDAAKNAYKVALPVIVEVLYTSEPVLDDFIKDYAIQFHTNTSFDSNTGQYRLEKLGFENIDFEYSLEGYSEAEVNQTERYLSIDKATGKIAVKIDPATGEKQTAAINREPLVKVKMSVGGVWVMSKLLKIKLTETAQLTDHWKVTLNPETLGCTPLVGSALLKTTGSGYEGATVQGALNANDVSLKIDFDQFFNKLGVSKDKFVELYSPQGVTGIASAISVTKDGQSFTDWSSDKMINNNLTVDYSDIWGSATSQNNYVYFGLRNQLKAGTYVITFAFETQSSIAKYKSFTIAATLVVKDPAPSWIHNAAMWENGHMLAYGKPTSENTSANPFVGPFLMNAAIEDGFTSFVPTAALGTCGTTCFTLVNPAQYNGDVTLVYENNKHMLKIKQGKDQWVGKLIKVRASVYVGSYGADRAIGAIVDVTQTTDFDVMFVDPVSYESSNNGWYLVDKAADNVNEGSYLPVYRLFKLWDTHKSQTNGMMWDPMISTGWFVRNGLNIGKSLYDMHGVSISYEINAQDNIPYVLEHATVSANGVVQWSNSLGDAVTTEQPIVVTVKIKHSWNNSAPMVKKITVNVKRANTEYKMPTVGFLKTGGQNDKTLGLN